MLTSWDHGATFLLCFRSTFEATVKKKLIIYEPRTYAFVPSSVGTFQLYWNLKIESTDIVTWLPSCSRQGSTQLETVQCMCQLKGSLWKGIFIIHSPFYIATDVQLAIFKAWYLSGVWVLRRAFPLLDGRSICVSVGQTVMGKPS